MSLGAGLRPLELSYELTGSIDSSLCNLAFEKTNKSTDLDFQLYKAYPHSKGFTRNVLKAHGVVLPTKR